MEKTGTEESSLRDLSREHSAFLRFLDFTERALADPSRSVDAESTLRFLDFVETVHHEKEERLLFPLLFGSAQLEVGGPKCMTFFTPRVLGAAWKDGFHALRDRLNLDVEAAANTPFRRSVFAANSMLKIPVSDHILGGLAASAMRGLLVDGSLPEGSQGRWRELFRLYAGLLRDHIQREEECLLPMFRRSLGPEQRDDYARRAAELDGVLGADAQWRKIFEALP